LAVERGGHGPKNTTVYRILPVLAENKGDIAMSPLTENKGDIQRAKGDIAMSPEPSIEPSIEAAEERASEPTPEPTPEPTAPAAAAKSQPTRDVWIIEYENVWGMMVASPYIAEQITDWQSRVTFPAWQHALRESTRANARNWRYLSRVLERLERDGYQEPQPTAPTTTTIDVDLELPL
jgi:DnaD/phage-associated family protein